MACMKMLGLALLASPKEKASGKMSTPGLNQPPCRCGPPRDRLGRVLP